MQRQGQIQSWTARAVWTKKRKGNFSMRSQEQWNKSPQSTWCTLHLWNTWIHNESYQNCSSGLWDQLSTWGLLYATDYFLIFMFILVYFLALVIIGGFVYWFGCSLFFLILFNFNNFFIFYFNNFTLFYLVIFFLSFSPFSSEPGTNRVLMLRPGVRHEALRLESWVQDIGPPENSQPHVISIGKSSPRDLCLNSKTQLCLRTSKLQCWTPHAKQLPREEYNPTH